MILISQTAWQPRTLLYFRGGLPPNIGVWGALKGAKVTPSDSPPSICYFALKSSEYLEPPGCRERFSVFVGVCPPKLEFGGHLGGQKLYHRIARLWFAKTPQRSSGYLKPFSSYFVASFRDIHTYGHTYIHTYTRKIWIALWRS